MILIRGNMPIRRSHRILKIELDELESILERKVTITMINNNEDALLRTGEAARILNVHHNTLRRWSELGIIGAYRINTRGDRRYSRKEVFDLLQQVKPNSGRLLY
jgi:excisionase family DNA binding protein